MKKVMKKAFVALTAVFFALSVNISVAAESGGGFSLDSNWLQQIIDNIIGGGTTEPTTENTTAPTTDPTTNNGVTNNTGTGQITTAPTTVPTTNGYVPDYTTVPTTEPVAEPEEPEESSEDMSNNLAELLEMDTAALIVQPTETFTLNSGGLVVNNSSESDFTWQKAALIAAAVLFVVLIALVAALLVQRSKRAKEEEEERKSYPSGGGTQQVPVEVMTPERIAELLGAAASKGENGESAAPDATAAAIRTAILMGQLSQNYSDPIIRKYTDEPVRFSASAVSALNADSVTGSDILKATDEMLSDITGEDTLGDAEKIASKYAEEGAPEQAASPDGESAVRVCPECARECAPDEMFCHGCGAYLG